MSGENRIRGVLWSFERFAALTATATLALVALGVYTAASAAGLACSAQWPLCDGGVLPSTLPSAIEWLHRLVAMVVGGLIVATAVWAWRETDRRTAAVATAAAALLPLQVSIGAVTVTIGGLVPWGYSPPVQTAHLLVGLSIFTALVVTAVRALGSRPDLVDRTLLGTAAAAAATVLFARPLALFGYGEAVQAGFIAATLACYAGLLAVAAWLPDEIGRDLALVTAAAAAVAVLLGRDVFVYGPTIRIVHALAVGVSVVGVVLLRVRVAVDVPRLSGGALRRGS